MGIVIVLSERRKRRACERLLIIITDNHASNYLLIYRWISIGERTSYTGETEWKSPSEFMATLSSDRMTNYLFSPRELRTSTRVDARGPHALGSPNDPSLSVLLQSARGTWMQVVDRGPRTDTCVMRVSKHNARHGFLNRSRSICTVISAPVHEHHIRIHPIWAFTCWCYTSCMGTQCTYSLPPRSTGQWLCASTSLRSASLRSASYHLFFLPWNHLLLLLLRENHRLLPTYDVLQLNFIRSFVRSCYSWREHPVVSETSMRDSSSFLDPPHSSLCHLRESLTLPTMWLLLTLSLGSFLPLFAATYFPDQQVFSRWFASRPAQYSFFSVGGRGVLMSFRDSVEAGLRFRNRGSFKGFLVLVKNIDLLFNEVYTSTVESLYVIFQHFGLCIKAIN